MATTFPNVTVVYVTSVLLILVTINAFPVDPVLNPEESQDSPSTLSPDYVSYNLTTTEPFLNDTFNESDNTTLADAEGEDGGKPAKDSNNTVIIVALLFVFTMVVKGFPVVVAYLLPRCSKNIPAEASEEDGAAAEEATEDGSNKYELDAKTNGGIPLPEYVKSPIDEKKSMEIRIPVEETEVITTEKSEHRCERL